MVSGGFDLGALVRDHGDIRAEAASCRAAAALFDFSFMTRLRVEGRGAASLIARLTPRRVDDLAPGRIRYALGVDAGGRVSADLTVWRFGAETFEVFSGTADALAPLRAKPPPATSVRDLSTDTVVLAVQGPASLVALSRAGPLEPLRALPYFAHTAAQLAGVACRVGRLGYTGERGFEIVLPRAARDVVWANLARYASPAGFAAADILRIEAGFLLFANELRFPVTAAELGLARFADAAAAATAAAAPQVRLLCFEAACAREPVLWQPPDGASFPPRVGELCITSACRSVVSGRVLGLGYAGASDRSPSLLDPSGNFEQIRAVSLPFYDPMKNRPRGGWGADLLADDASHSLDR